MSKLKQFSKTWDELKLQILNDSNFSSYQVSGMVSAIYAAVAPVLEQKGVKWMEQQKEKGYEREICSIGSGSKAFSDQLINSIFKGHQSSIDEFLLYAHEKQTIATCDSYNYMDWVIEESKSYDSYGQITTLNTAIGSLFIDVACLEFLEANEKVKNKEKDKEDSSNTII